MVHVDADVAGEDPANEEFPIQELAGILPCEKPCPPASDTTNALRTVALDWMGETSVPHRTVLCTPSKSTEAWIVAVFFPDDREMKKKGWECCPKPANRLGQQPKDKRFAKKQSDYEARSATIRSAWPELAARLSEARRFQDEFQHAVLQSET